MKIRNFSRYRSALALLVVASITASSASAAVPQGECSGFVAENSAAMNKMMIGMDVRPSADVDRDFAAMMIPHHQGAIDMARAELRYGSNEQLRRIAQEIIVDQQQEIAAMHLALGQPLPASIASPTQVTPARCASAAAVASTVSPVRIRTASASHLNNHSGSQP
jgi:hypothetical protein